MRGKRQISSHDHQEFFFEGAAFFRKEFTLEENKCISLDLTSSKAQNGTNQWGCFSHPTFQNTEKE